MRYGLIHFILPKKKTICFGFRDISKFEHCAFAFKKYVLMAQQEDKQLYCEKKNIVRKTYNTCPIKQNIFYMVSPIPSGNISSVTDLYVPLDNKKLVV